MGKTGVGDSGIRMLLDLACMSVLEECSYTRKDGQYLRWDYRSGRPHAKTDMGYIPTFEQALVKRLGEMSRDWRGLARLANRCGKDFERGILFYEGRNMLPLTDKRMFAVPLSELWER